MKTREQQGWDNLAQILTNTLDKLAEEDQKKQKKPTRQMQLKREAKKTITRWENTFETEVNGKPEFATVVEEQTEENGHEINKTTITVGKTTKTRYTIDRRELDLRIDETATAEEDRIDQYGDLPF